MPPHGSCLLYINKVCTYPVDVNSDCSTDDRSENWSVLLRQENCQSIDIIINGGPGSPCLFPRCEAWICNCISNSDRTRLAQSTPQQARD